MADDRLAATLDEAKRIAGGLQFACRIPDKVPDFTACGGPAAEAYWDYFTPARISSLLAAVDAALKHHQPEPAVRLVPCEEHARWRGPLVGDNDNLAVRRACLRCQVFDEPYCRRCVDDDGRFQDWPCPEYRAITAELAKEARDGD